MAVRIAKAVIEKNMPINLIFAGPAGTGKTSIAKIIAKEILGADRVTNLLEKNASEEVRMKFIRTVLKNFISVFSGRGKIKIVILDEADNIPSVDQQALRRLIEASHKHCRYILICNYLSEIIDPIRSRGAIIRYGIISDDAIRSIVESILDAEKITLNVPLSELVTTLSSACNGDVRLLINTLQSCDKNDPIKSIRNMLGIIDPVVLRAIYLSIIKGRFSKIINNLNITRSVSPRHFLLQLGNYIVEDKDLSNDVLGKVCKIIADYDERLTLTGDQEAQLLGCIAKLCLIMGGKNE